MKQHLELAKDIIENGSYRPGRGNQPTRALFGKQMTFDLMDGLPISTTQYIDFRSLLAELFWFLSGSTNNDELIHLGAKFWTPWALEENVLKNTPVDGYTRACSLAIKMNQSVSEMIKHLNGLSMGDAEALMQEYGIKDHESVVAIKKGSLGPIYGEMWRNFNGADQIAQLVKNLLSNPYSRRHVVSSWNPSLLPDEALSHSQNVMAGKQVLPPCHPLWQVFVAPVTPKQLVKYLQHNRFVLPYMINCQEMINEIISELQKLSTDGSRLSANERDERLKEIVSMYQFENTCELVGYSDSFKREKISLPINRLSLQLYARSQDFMVGTVVNVPSYAVLTHILAAVINAVPGDYIHTMGDCHIYENQIDQAQLQLDRRPMPLPALALPDHFYSYNWEKYVHSRPQYMMNIFTDRSLDPYGLADGHPFSLDDFKLLGYDHHEKIKYKVLV